MPEPAFTSVYKTVDDCLISTDVYLPPGSTDNASPRPVAMIVHGGAWIIGHSKMNSMLQFQDCLDRGWIVVAPDHRLCPAVNILEGPIADIRDLLLWIVAGEGGLDGEIARQGGSKCKVDAAKIVAIGTSSGATLVHSLVFGDGLPPVAAVVDFYGAKDFRGRRPTGAMLVPPELAKQVMEERPVPTKCRGPLDGNLFPASIPGTPAMLVRQRYLRILKASGETVRTLFPDEENYHLIDPLLNVESVGTRWPPTWVLHGTEDEAVDVEVNRKFYEALQTAGVRSRYVELEGAGHMFVGTMKKGDKAYEAQKKALDEVDDLLKTG